MCTYGKSKKNHTKNFVFSMGKSWFRKGGAISLPHLGSIFNPPPTSRVKDKERLIEHRREQHKPHICRDCGHMFYWRNKLNIHHRIHKKKPCPNCNIVFTTKYLAKHVSKCKPKQSGRKQYDCTVCGYSVREELDVDGYKEKVEVFKRAPRMGVEGNLKNPYPCVSCGRLYGADWSNLLVHQWWDGWISTPVDWKKIT